MVLFTGQNSLQAIANSARPPLHTEYPRGLSLSDIDFVDTIRSKAFKSASAILKNSAAKDSEWQPTQLHILIKVL